MRKTSVCFVFLSFILLMGVSGQQSPYYESEVVDNFNGEGSALYPPRTTVGYDKIPIGELPVLWKTFASRFASEGYPQLVYVDNSWPIDRHGISPDNADELKTLGIRVRFTREGYNFFDIIPGAEIDGTWVNAPLPLPGEVRMVDLWVWGAGFEYILEAHIRDYKGTLHVFEMINTNEPKKRGILNFTGWNNLSIHLPSSLRQGSRYSTQKTNLSLVKFVVRTAPDERVDDFFIYLDDLKILTNKYKYFYDGKDLSDPNKIDEVWGVGSANVNSTTAENTEAAGNP